MSFWLEYDQDGSKQEYPFDSSSVSVGREKNADFVLDHPTVSRQHALIVKNNGGFKLVVLSRGGLTALDGNQVQGEVDLYDGSVVHFGQLSFTFRSNEAPPAPSQGMSSGSQGASGFGATPSPGFGGAQPQGFGGQSQQGQQGGQQAQAPHQGGQGFGGGPPGGGFGAQAPGAGTNGSDAQSGAFGGGSFGGGGFGGGGQQAAGGAQDSAPQEEAFHAPETNNGIMSWDAIAASAEQDSHDPADGPGPTDFERIQAAAQKAEQQSKSNPVVLVGAGILIVGMLVFILMPQGPTGDGGPVNPGNNINEQPPIKFQPGVLDCVGTAECMAKARQSYKVGMETLDKVEVDIRNRFEGYRRLVMAEEFSKKAGNETLPAEFAELEARRDLAREELNAIFQQQRVKYHNLSKRKMYNEMVDVLNEVTALFPYKSAREHQWALRKERQLKEQGNYPQKFQ